MVEFKNNKKAFSLMETTIILITAAIIIAAATPVITKKAYHFAEPGSNISGGAHGRWEAYTRQIFKINDSYSPHGTKFFEKVTRNTAASPNQIIVYKRCNDNEYLEHMGNVSSGVGASKKVLYRQIDGAVPIRDINGEIISINIKDIEGNSTSHDYISRPVGGEYIVEEYGTDYLAGNYNASSDVPFNYGSSKRYLSDTKYRFIEGNLVQQVYSSAGEDNPYRTSKFWLLKSKNIEVISLPWQRQYSGTILVKEGPIQQQDGEYVAEFTPTGLVRNAIVHAVGGGGAGGGISESRYRNNIYKLSKSDDVNKISALRTELANRFRESVEEYNKKNNYPFDTRYNIAEKEAKTPDYIEDNELVKVIDNKPNVTLSDFTNKTRIIINKYNGTISGLVDLTDGYGFPQDVLEYTRTVGSATQLADKYTMADWFNLKKIASKFYVGASVKSGKGINGPDLVWTVPNANSASCLSTFSLLPNRQYIHHFYGQRGGNGATAYACVKPIGRVNAVFAGDKLMTKIPKSRVDITGQIGTNLSSLQYYVSAPSGKNKTVDLYTSGVVDDKQVEYHSSARATGGVGGRPCLGKHISSNGYYVDLEDIQTIKFYINYFLSEKNNGKQFFDSLLKLNDITVKSINGKTINYISSSGSITIAGSKKINLSSHTRSSIGNESLLNIYKQYVDKSSSDYLYLTFIPSYIQDDKIINDKNKVKSLTRSSYLPLTDRNQLYLSGDVFCDIDPSKTNGSNISSLKCNGTEIADSGFAESDCKNTDGIGDETSLYNHRYIWTVPYATNMLAYGEAGQPGEYVQTKISEIEAPIQVKLGKGGNWDRSNNYRYGRRGANGTDTEVSIDNKRLATARGGSGGRQNLTTLRYQLCTNHSGICSSLAKKASDYDKFEVVRNSVKCCNDEQDTHASNVIVASSMKPSLFENIRSLTNNSQAVGIGAGRGAEGYGSRSTLDTVYESSYAYNASSNRTINKTNFVPSNTSKDMVVNSNFVKTFNEDDYNNQFIKPSDYNFRGGDGAVIITW